MIDYALLDKSNTISCNNIKKLTIDYEDNNYKIFTNHFNQLCNDKNNDLESHIFKGINIHKKNCISKKNNYNKGDWIKQFDIFNIDNSFNILTKKL